VDLVKLLLSEPVKKRFPKIDPCANNNECVKLSCSMGDVEMLEYLLSDEILRLYPEIESCLKDDTLIRLASRNNRQNMLKFLLGLSDEKTGRFPSMFVENFTVYNGSLLNYPIILNYFEIVKILLEKTKISKKDLIHSLDLAKLHNYYGNEKTDIINLLIETINKN
jgi:hypothetical protein